MWLLRDQEITIDKNEDKEYFYFKQKHKVNKILISIRRYYQLKSCITGQSFECNINPEKVKGLFVQIMQRKVKD